MSPSKVHIDFETRSKVDIWDVGAWVYITHPTTEILCVVYAVDEETPVLIPRKEIEDGFPNAVDLSLFADNKYITFHAHNAHFERLVWEHIMVKKYGFPEIPITRWFCSMAKASACGLPKSLEKVSKALNLPLQKDTAGRHVMLKMSKPRKPTKTNPAVWHEDPEDFERLYDYCKTDVIVERLVDNALPDLNQVEQQIWMLDQTINDRGIKIDIDAVDTMLSLNKRMQQDGIKELITLTNGYLTNVSQIQRVRNWLADQGYPFPNLTKATVEEALANPDLPDKIRRVLWLRTLLGKTSTAKYVTMKQAVDKNDHRLKDTLLYHSAHTGRWGGKLVQLHNLPQGSIKDTDTAIELAKQEGAYDILRLFYGQDMGKILSSCIRGMLVSEKGKKLLVADYSAIEARVLLWLVNDTVALEMYRSGKDLYVDIASTLYDKPPHEITKTERQVGKTLYLGCMYGMGCTYDNPRFYNVCIGAGIDISFEQAEYAVHKVYRKKYKKVVDLWYALERQALSAFSGMPSAHEIVNGIKYGWKRVSTRRLCLMLPSGRTLTYVDPEIRDGQLTHMKVDTATKQWVRTHTYGGKLAENMVQGIARDILAWAMRRLEKNGFEVILTVHDEIVCEGVGMVDNMVNIMCVLPPWAQGCPIAAEGWEGTRYKKG